jgi:glycosidase
VSRFALAAVLLWVGCIARVPQQKASTPTPIAVGWALETDQSGSPLAPPDKLKARVESGLGDRNLQIKNVDELGAARVTVRRLEALRQVQPTGFALLIEARPSFFSQHDGRYRWSVAVKVTVSAKPGELAEDSFTVAALLQFEHEREAEALSAVSDEIAQRVGTLVDAMLVGAPVSRAAPGGLVYFVMVDRFANGDPTNDRNIDLEDPAAFHGGDLQGVIDHLDWLQSLGVHTVWLSPVFAMRQEKVGPWGAFHGYWTWDLSSVEPRFGDEALLVRLADSLHARGMRLVMDLVLNHVGLDAPLVKERPEWFHHRGDITDWNDPDQLVNGDVHGLPDLATEREDVYRSLLEATLKWVKLAHPDGFRLDAVKHMPLSFWARFNADVRKVAGQDFELLGEMLDGDPEVLARVQREGGFSTMFDFPLQFAMIDVFCRGMSASRLGAVLTNDRLYSAPAALTTLADNHDLPRLISACGLDAEKANQALAFLLTARGVPSVIWGTETGQVGEKDPPNRASMRFVETPVKAEIARWAALRGPNPALARGAPLILEASRDVFAYLRLVDEQAALFVFNRTEQPWKPKDLGSTWREAFTGVQVEPVTPAHSVRLFLTPLQPHSFSALAAIARGLSTGRGEVRKIRFTAHGLLGGKDDEVRVVGSGPELGAWHPEAGLKLVGLSASATLPLRGVFEFKLVVKSGSGPWRWQSGDNLVLQVGDGSSQVDVQWREG